MTVYGLGQPKSNKVAVIPIEVPRPTDGLTPYKGKMAALELRRFNQFWDLMDAVQVHGYIRAAMSVIGRSTVGAGWSLVKSDEFASEATERQRKRLLQFYTMPTKKWDNVKDFQSNVYKIMIGAMYLRYFGQCAFQIIRNEEGRAVGFDHLPGYVAPNVDNNGYFKRPAFIQYPYRDPSIKVEFESARDIVYIVNPEWTGLPTGGTDIEALSDFAIPIDLYLQLAAREYMKNRDKPEAFYVLPSDISDEAFDAFTKALEARYAGPTNIGRSPITVAGELEVKELSKLPADLPYQEARKDTRQELLAVSGVAGAKLGLTDSLSQANLREARREFHESTMEPLFRLIEVALYEQVHMREFGISGWLLKFNNPDFLNAVEKATVHMRYHDMGVYSPNEIRNDLGRPARKDEWGDKYVDQTAAEEKEQAREDAQNRQGNPPEGREQNPDAPSQTGEPTLDDQDPPRGDQHDDTTQRALFEELRQWHNFVINRIKRGKVNREFGCSVIPDYLYDAIQDGLRKVTTVEEARAYFAQVETMLREAADYRYEE